MPSSATVPGLTNSELRTRGGRFDRSREITPVGRTAASKEWLRILTFENVRLTLFGEFRWRVPLFRARRPRRDAVGPPGRSGNGLLDCTHTPAGRLINISSSTTVMMLPNYSTHVATKGAVEQLTRSLAKELGPRGPRMLRPVPVAFRPALLESATQ